MRLFQATAEDVGRIEECATLCCLEHGEERTGGPFNWPHYRMAWETMIVNERAAMFLYEEPGSGDIVGGIGGIKYVNILTGKPRAAQVFLYVQPLFRGALSLSRLLNAFEMWAIEQRCHDVLATLLDTMPPKTRLFYEHKEYRDMETVLSKLTGVTP